ncbi:MAG: zinc ribbon domain-containing protein [Deltaproteobacteria bacterium]|nr:zinc ribbon domain-containing protein [Deltaproteobacteria bacterium]
MALSLEKIHRLLTARLEPGETLLAMVNTREETHKLARVALAGVTPTSAAEYFMGLTPHRIILLFHNIFTGILKPRGVSGFGLHDIADASFEVGQGDARLIFLLRDGKNRLFICLDQPPGNLVQAQQFWGQLENLRRQVGFQGAPGAAWPPPPLPQPRAVGSLPAGLSCSGCGRAIPTGSRFCEHCGAPVAQVPRQCPRCGHSPAPTARFCSRCGAPLAV